MEGPHPLKLINLDKHIQKKTTKHTETGLLDFPV